MCLILQVNDTIQQRYAKIQIVKQVKSSFFSDLLKYATKIYQDMMILFDHA